MAEIIAEPTALSKVIALKFKINDVDVPKTTQLSTNKQFNTTDTDAWFTFELDGLAATGGTYDLTLINLDDKSIFHHANVLFQALPFHYKLNSSEDVTLNEIRHAGRWLGQLVVTLSNGDTTARQFGFNIAGHILDGQDAQVILLSDYQALINTINLAKDDLAQYNIDYSALIADVTTAEGVREQAEIDRAAVFAALVESEMVAQNVETKLTEKEATFAPRMLSVETQLAEAGKYASQADYVDMIKKRLGIKSMSYYKISDGSVMLVFGNGARHICYSFTKDANDDFIKFAMARLGGSSNLTTRLLCDYSNIVSRTGASWNTSTVNNYVKTVGDTFTCNVKGSAIILNAYCDNRGGVWRFVIDDNAANPIDVSVYRAATGIQLITIVPFGLDETVTHKVVGTFMGDDPVNVPIGGVGTARGWVTDNNTPTTAAIQGIIQDEDNNIALLVEGSNKEFAFSVNYNAEQHFIPEHDIPSAFKVEDAQFIIDGAAIDLTTTPVSKMQSCDSFRLLQHVYGKFGSTGTNLLEIWTEHSADKNGGVNTSGRFKALQNCLVSTGYAPMLPLVVDVLNECVTSIGNSRINDKTGAMFNFPEEKDLTYSVIGLDANRPDYVAAYSLEYPLKTNRVGLSGKSDPQLKVNQGTAYHKVYNQIFANHALVVGDEYKWFTSFIIGLLANAYQQFK